MSNEYKLEHACCLAPMGDDRDETQGMTDGCCKVRVFFAAEGRGADVFPRIMERLTSSFQNVPGPAKEQFAPLR
jgi:hypothetical protein